MPLEIAIVLSLLTEGHIMAKSKEPTPAQIINARIDEVIARYKNADADIHEVAVLALVHYQTCGDYRPLIRLAQSLPKAIRTNALLKWCIKFSPLKQKDGAPSELYHDAEKAAKDNAFRLDAARATPFYSLDANEGKEPPVFDLETAVLRLIKKATKAQESGKAEVPAEALTALRGIANTLSETKAA